MPEIVRQAFEEYKPLSKEQKSVANKLLNVTRRIVTWVKRSEHRIVPEQPFDLAGIIKAEKEISPDRAKEIEENSCAVRAIMSAAALALGIKKITAERQEWDARSKQMDAPLFPDTDINQELIDLYEGYSHNSTPLGNAIKQVHMTLIEGQTIRQIKKRIRKGEQVIIASTNTDPPHTFHAGLKGNRIIALSDEQLIPENGQTPYYHEPELPSGTFTIISVTQKTDNSNLEPVTHNDLALAA